jgi:hypothetical protein
MLSLASGTYLQEGFPISVRDSRSWKQVRNSTGTIESIARIALGYQELETLERPRFTSAIEKDV